MEILDLAKNSYSEKSEEIYDITKINSVNTFLENIYNPEGRKSLSNDKNSTSVNSNINFELFFFM